MRWFRIVTVGLAAAALLAVCAAGSAFSSTAPEPMFVAIAAGGYHTCAVTRAGGVQCWGYNRAAQLGDGTTTDRTTPVAVTGLASGVVAISAGYSHTCVLMASGGVKCWGANHLGQLGDGTRTASATPVDVVGLTSGVTAISTGGVYSCARTNVGGAWCWGNNDPGQLGDGTRTARSIPVAVFGLASGVSGIAAGPDHACAIVGGGGVKCWGNNGGGQLGDGTRVSSDIPVDVVGLTSGVSAIATGYSHTCALTTVGGVKCWGSNHYGGLGAGPIPGSETPVDVVGLASGVVAIGPGDASGHTCVVTITGGVECWGHNAYGQLGDGASVDSSTPVGVAGLGSGVEAVAVGYYHTCALMDTGGVKCWGNNYAGALGDGTKVDRHVPVDVIASVPQMITVHGSKAAGTIARGTRVSFVATVRPIRPSAEQAVIRFVVYQRVAGAWRQVARRDVYAGATGHATLGWTFYAAGSWYVRAQAKADLGYAVSGWSPPIRYTVR